MGVMSSIKWPAREIIKAPFTIIQQKYQGIVRLTYINLTDHTFDYFGAIMKQVIKL